MSHLPDNSTANSLLPADPDDVLLASVISIATDNELLKTIKDGYKLDPFCVKLNDALDYEWPMGWCILGIVWSYYSIVTYGRPFSYLPMTHLDILDLRSHTAL